MKIEEMELLCSVLKRVDWRITKNEEERTKEWDLLESLENDSEQLGTLCWQWWDSIGAVLYGDDWNGGDEFSDMFRDVDDMVRVLANAILWMKIWR